MFGPRSEGVQWRRRRGSHRHRPERLLVQTTVSKYYQQQPVDQFVSDLPIIEKLDQYEVIDSIEFLDLLQKEGVFQNDDVYFDGVGQ